MERAPQEHASSWERELSRRDVLKLGAFLAGAAAIPLLGGCAPPTGSPAGSALGSARASGPLTVLTGPGDSTEPAIKKVYDDFAALNPLVELDIREIPGGGPEWDRLARATIASGEPVDLVTINGQQVQGWVRDGLLADLGADSALATVLSRVPGQFHLPGPGEATTRAFPLAVTRGVHTTGIYYNKAILDQVGLEVPQTFADLRAAVQPLSKIGVAPLVHCSGDVFFNQILLTWVLPMVAERTGDPVQFVGKTVRGDIRYDGPEWTEAFGHIADLRTSGVLLDGSGAADYATMQRLLLDGKAAMTYNGSWLLPLLQGGTPTVPFDLHVAPPPTIEGASRARPILAWAGFALPAQAQRGRDNAYAFMEFASRPDVDRSVVAGLQVYSPIAGSNDAIANTVAKEFLPMFKDAITSIDWLWEPEVKDEIDSQVQAIVNGTVTPAAAGQAVQAVAEELRASGRSYYH